MSGEKTEQATPKKLREARKRGEVAKSRELSTAAILLSVVATAIGLGDYAVSQLIGCLELCLATIASDSLASPQTVLMAGLGFGGRAALPFLLVAMLAAMLSNFLQIGPLLSFQAIQPKLERLDVIKGIGNLFKQKQLIELLKSILKIAIVSYVVWVVIGDGLRGIAGLAGANAGVALRATGDLLSSLILRVGGAVLAIAIADVLYQRWRFQQDQKMSKDEVKREHKESEGDPHAKQARDRAHREILEHSAVEQVRTADVLVVNPTHYAVALSYDEDGDAAPEVLAKGRDHLAKRMIEAARQSGVPVMRDVPLAHALFELPVGEEIPELLYEGVAAVLRAVWKEEEGR